MVCGISNINSRQGGAHFPVFSSNNLFVCSDLFTSFGSIDMQVHKAVDACKSVLRGLHSNKVAQRELDRVRYYTTRIIFLFSVINNI
jgi:hypothetical protein